MCPLPHFHAQPATPPPPVDAGCSRLSLIGTDTSALLLIWMLLHLLAPFCILKTQFLSLSQPQTDGSRSARLSFRSWKAASSLAWFILEAVTPSSALCTERMPFISRVTRLSEGASYFLLLCSTFLHPPSRGAVFLHSQSRYK